MTRKRRAGALGAVILACLVAAGLAAAQLRSNAGGGRPLAASSGCQLSPGNSKIQHVVYLQFDNTHYMRDNQSVASDLEQMPHLLNFLKSNGTLFTNDHSILISHTAGGILSTQTGLYPDRHGMNVSNSYFYFGTNKNPAFSTSFKYWTDLVDDTTGLNNKLPNMVTDGQKNTPAPWVPFTRAGCDFGAFSLANIELENTGTGTFGDMSQAFGTGSTEWNEANVSNAAPPGTALRAKALTDYIGIAIHCAKGGGICAANSTNAANARMDKLPDEPGSYLGYLALFGAKYVNPAITGGNACVNDTSGHPVTDPFTRCGFPGFDGGTAAVTLGYLATMQEAGIPVTWGYISDAHDNHRSAFPAPPETTYPRASGPGEDDYVAQLKAYDDAFATFFDRLKSDGIDQSNTLFMVTVDEGDHYAGGIGTPAGCNGVNTPCTFSHTNCDLDVASPSCPSNILGEVNVDVRQLLGQQKPDPTRPTFSTHNDSAPTVYVNGQLDRTNPLVRNLERDSFSLTTPDPYLGPGPHQVGVQMADPVQEKTLHMVNADSSRTPTFTLFANPDLFIRVGKPAAGWCAPTPNPTCIYHHPAWSHGDIQPEIATTWVGFVGPGIQNSGIDSSTWTDHTNVRPTMLSLLGLKDDYLNDGRVLIEALDKKAIPKELNEHKKTTTELGAIYEQLNAPFGQFAMDTLSASTRGLKSTDESIYSSIETSIQDLTNRRDALAGKIKSALNGAAFDGQQIKEKDAKDWIAQAQSLIDQAAALAAG